MEGSSVAGSSDFFIRRYPDGERIFFSNIYRGGHLRKHRQRVTVRQLPSRTSSLIFALTTPIDDLSASRAEGLEFDPQHYHPTRGKCSIKIRKYGGG